QTLGHAHRAFAATAGLGRSVDRKTTATRTICGRCLVAEGADQVRHAERAPRIELALVVHREDLAVVPRREERRRIEAHAIDDRALAIELEQLRATRHREASAGERREA